MAKTTKLSDEGWTIVRNEVRYPSNVGNGDIQHVDFDLFHKDHEYDSEPRKICTTRLRRTHRRFGDWVIDPPSFGLSLTAAEIRGRARAHNMAAKECDKRNLPHLDQKGSES